MLDLEGTRNERAVVILVSYIIGFVSAYIWLGVSVSLAPSHAPIAGQDNQPEAFTFAKASKSVDFSSVTYKEGVLEYHDQDGSEILSMAAYRVPQESRDYLIANGGQGVHEDITSFLLSRDANFVFFCENNGGDTCTGYIYDVAGDVIRPVRAADNPSAFSERDAQLARFTEAGLEIGELQSVSSSEPWLLTR